MQSLLSQQSVGLLVSVARRGLKQATGSHARRHHLSPQQFWVLVGIAERRRPSLGELARGLWLDLPTASRIVAALAQRGFVRASGDPSDRRCRRLGLTRSGTILAARLQPVARSLRAGLVRGMGTKEQQTLCRLLVRVIDNAGRLGCRSQANTAERDTRS